MTPDLSIIEKQKAEFKKEIKVLEKEFKATSDNLGTKHKIKIIKDKIELLEKLQREILALRRKWAIHLPSNSQEYQNGVRVGEKRGFNSAIEKIAGESK